MTKVNAETENLLDSKKEVPVRYVKHRGRWVDPAKKLLWILKQPVWAGGVFTTQDGKLLYRKGSAVLTINDELEQRIRDMTTDTDSKGLEA